MERKMIKKAVSVLGVTCLGAFMPSLSTPTASAQPLLIPPTKQVALTESHRTVVRGSFVAKGGGARNTGQTDINLGLSSSAKVKQAFLYWAVMRRPNEAIPNTITFNGESYTGEVVGTSGDACWPGGANSGNEIDVFRADVTSDTRHGNNEVRDMPSFLQDGTPPNASGATAAAFPLADGATLFVIFEHPKYDCNEVVLFDGAQTFAFGPVETDLGEFTVAPESDSLFSRRPKGRSYNPNPEDATTVYMVADGQSRFLGGTAQINGQTVAGGAAPEDAWIGAEGAADPSACTGSIDDPNCDGLWDTLNVDLSSMFTPGTAMNVVAGVDAGPEGDCVTWFAQGLAIKTKHLSDKGEQGGGGHGKSDDDDDHFFGGAKAAAPNAGGGVSVPGSAADNTWGRHGSSKRGGKKVDLCHVPPGNPANAHTINISVNAVDSHLDNHGGDYLGECSLSHVCECGSEEDTDSTWGLFGNHDDDDEGGRKNNNCAGDNKRGGDDKRRRDDDDDDHR